MGSYMPPDVRASNILHDREIIKPPTPVEDICRLQNICLLPAWKRKEPYCNEPKFPAKL